MKMYDAAVTNVYERNKQAEQPVVANIGGADSSKSHSIAQLFIEKFFNERKKTFLICRKTLPSLKITAMRLVINLLKEYGNYRRLKHNKADHTLTAEEFDNFLIFLSIDDVEKIKSTEFNYIWMEEANEFSWNDFIILYLRNRAKTIKGEPNRMYLSFNPADEQGWINQKLFNENYVQKIKSTYKDNPFAAEVDKAVLEGLRTQDESYWKIYARGEFARVKGQIHELIMMSGPYPECEETIYGLDFGFVNPNELLKIDIDLEHMSLYVTELLWRTGMTNAELKKEMKELIPEEDRDQEIYADSAEPARIEEIYHEGFNIHSSDKSVIDGIDCVNRFKIFSREENVNFNREMNGYKRKVDKKGEVLEEPVKFRDHGPNAIRYAVFTHLRDRLLGADPAWTIHTGMKEEPEEEIAPESPVSDERQAPDPSTYVASQGKQDMHMQKPEPDKEELEEAEKKKKPRGDKSWAV